MEREISNIQANIERRENRICQIANRMECKQVEREDLQKKIKKMDQTISLKDTEILEFERRHRELAKKRDREKRDFKDWDRLIGEYERLKSEMKNIPNWLRSCFELKFNEHKMQEHQFGRIIHNNLMIPGDNFRRAVYGKVYTFFKVRKQEHLIAINCVSEKNLFKIAIEDASIGESILKYKLVKGKTRLLPMSNLRVRGFNPKSSSRKIRNGKRVSGVEIVAEARHLVRLIPKAEVYLPHELISFEEHHSKLIDFVFQNCLIVSTMEVGRVVCDNMKIPCVTLQGESVSEGMLSGGYRGEREPLLRQAQNFRGISLKVEKLEREIKVEEEERVRIKETRLRMEGVQKTLRKIREFREGVARRKKDLSNRINLTCEETLKTEKREIQRGLVENRIKIKALQQRLVEMTKQIQQGIGGVSRSRSLIEITSELKKLEEREEEEGRKQIQAEGVIRNHSEEQKILVEKRNNLEQDLGRDELVLQNMKSKRENLEKEVGFLMEDRARTDKQFQQIKKNKREMMERKKKLEADIQREKDSSRNLQEEIKVMTSKIEVLQYKMSKEKRLPRQDEEMKKLGESLDITCKGGSEQDLFQKMDQVEGRIHELTKTLSKLRRLVRFESEDLLNKLEKDVEYIGQHKGIIQQDLQGIRSNIQGLNQKKHFAVVKCFEQVNQNLKNIFSSLVPGAMAKMELWGYEKKVNSLDSRNLAFYNYPVESKTNVSRSKIKQGIQMKISLDGGRTFNGTINELSGGQRSLLALALLLSMLKYRPAPFYIFDEIDAALDLSHTNNISELIVNHFPYSQFLVISLKEEFFRNANVLFKASLVDGQSNIIRVRNK